MSNAELDTLILVYLDGSATRDQVIRLRDAIKTSPEVAHRFQARLRLHRAQLSFLRHKEGRSSTGAIFGLHRYAQRFGRVCAHLCLLALVFVELRVVIPAEYSGLLCYVDAPAVQDDRVFDGEDGGMFFSEDEPEGALGAGMPDVAMPAASMPDAMDSPDDITGEA